MKRKSRRGGEGKKSIWINTRKTWEKKAETNPTRGGLGRTEPERSEAISSSQPRPSNLSERFRRKGKRRHITVREGALAKEQNGDRSCDGQHFPYGQRGKLGELGGGWSTAPFQQRSKLKSSPPGRLSSLPSSSAA